MADTELRRGQLLTRLREQRLWTRERLAKEAGVSTTTVTQAEHGRTHVRLGTIRKLAEALDINPQELLYPEEDREPALPKAERAAEEPEQRREASLLDDPRIVAVLREWGYETHEEHRTAFQDFDPGIDKKGIPRGIERAEEKLQQDLNELLRELRRPTNYKKLFPERSSFSKADELGSDHIQVLRASYASKLRREVRRIYERRFRALESFGEALYDAGRTKAFLVPARRLNIVKAAREHALEKAFEGQEAG